MTLHLAVLIFVPGCIAAGWWQITRAQDGNGLSYLYSVEWPIFAILGVVFWWMLIHTDYDKVGLKGMRSHTRSTPAETSADSVDVALEAPLLPPDADPAMAAYNARLAALAEQGPKTWRTPERTVVRRDATS